MKHRVVAVSVALALALVTAGAFASQRHGDPPKGSPAGAGAVTQPGVPPAGGAHGKQQSVRINHVVIDLGTSTPVPGAIGAPPASDNGREHGHVPSALPASSHGLRGTSKAADAQASRSHGADDDRDDDHGHRDGRHGDDDCDDDDDDDDDDDCGGPGDLSGTPTAVMPTKTATTPAGGGAPPTATPTAPPPSPTSVAATPTATPTVRTCGSKPPPPEPCP